MNKEKHHHGYKILKNRGNKKANLPPLLLCLFKKVSTYAYKLTD